MSYDKEKNLREQIADIICSVGCDYHGHCEPPDTNEYHNKCRVRNKTTDEILNNITLQHIIDLKEEGVQQ